VIFFHLFFFLDHLAREAFRRCVRSSINGRIGESHHVSYVNLGDGDSEKSQAKASVHGMPRTCNYAGNVIGLTLRG
jgi:hypothetical protein